MNRKSLRDKAISLVCFSFLLLSCSTAWGELTSYNPQTGGVTAIYTQSEWFTLMSFQLIDTVCSDEDAEINFHGVTISIESLPGGRASQTWHPAYLAEIALAVDRTSNVIDVQPFPVDLTSTSITFRFPAGFEDAGITVCGRQIPITFYVRVRTSVIPNNSTFRGHIAFCPGPGGIELSSSTFTPTLDYYVTTCFDFYSDPVVCVDNVEDWLPSTSWNWANPTGPDSAEYSRKLGNSGLANDEFKPRFPKELDFFPQRQPYFRTTHPESNIWMEDLECPQLIPINSAPYPLFGIELGYGIPHTVPNRLQSVSFRMISTGQAKELTTDGIDNDLDGAVDDFLINDDRISNRNDDADFWVDVNGDYIYTPGYDAVLIDSNRDGFCDYTDLKLFGGVGPLEFNSQQVGYNDDHDVYGYDRGRYPDPDTLPDFIPGQDEVFSETDGLSNIYPNTYLTYDGFSLDGTQIGDTVLSYGVEVNQNANGEDSSQYAEDDGDVWTGAYDFTRDPFNASLSNGYYLRTSDPVAVFLDDGDEEDYLDSGDHLISFPGSVNNPLPLDNVNNLANRFLQPKGINVRGLNDDYLYKHPRSATAMAEFFDNNPTFFDTYDALVKANPYLTWLDYDPSTEEVTERFMLDATDYFRIPIGDFEVRTDDATSIWADMDGNRIITVFDARADVTLNLLGAQLFPPAEYDDDGSISLPDEYGTGPAVEIQQSGYAVFAEILEEEYNGVDDDGDGYVDEDCGDFPVFLLIDEDEYDFYVNIDSNGFFSPIFDNYYKDLNADGVYQVNELLIQNSTDTLIAGINYLALPGVFRLDNDSDGTFNEDPQRRAGNDSTVTPKALTGDLLDEDAFDGVDNDRDGVVDEDSWWVPVYPLVDEERLDFFVDEPGGSLGIFDNGIDEYYIDLNANGVYDPALPEDNPYARREDECIDRGADQKISMFPGQSYENGIDDDKDGLVNEDVRDSCLQEWDFEPDVGGDINDGFQLWADTNNNGTFDTGDTQISNGFSIERNTTRPVGVPSVSQFDDSYNQDFQISISGDASSASNIPLTDDEQFDFFVCVRTDGGDYRPTKAAAEDADRGLKESDAFGIDWGDDFSSQIVYKNILVSYGQPIEQEMSGRQVAAFFAEDIIGYHSPTAPTISIDEDRDGFSGEEAPNGLDDDGDGEDDDNNPLTKARADGLDNDGDGLIDEGIDEDLGLIAVGDGLDGDGDGRVDEELLNGYDEDGDGEDDDNNPLTRAKADGIDNDGDGFIDEGIDWNEGLEQDADPDFSIHQRWLGYRARQFRGVPYVDATSLPVQVIGLNICDGPSAGVMDEVIDSIRVNFVNEDLEGNGQFDLTDLLPLSSNEDSGVAIYRDNKTSGSIGQFDLNDTYVELTSITPDWDADGAADPVVKNGGHYVVLKPKSGIEIPNDDFHTATGQMGNWGYDYFIVVKTSATIDYHDAFRMFIRDGDVKFRNGRNTVNTSIEADPVAANVPTFLSNLQTVPGGSTTVPVVANTKSTAVIGLDMHDANKTFDGSPSKVEEIMVHFHNVGGDTDFTSTDLAPLQPVERQWVKINPITGQTDPYQLGMGANSRIGSVNGISLYRDAPNSDTKGVFDDPFDLNVANPDTPVLLSGYEEWQFVQGWDYQVTLFLDTPDWTSQGGREEDLSPIDPFDPEPYETLPEQDQLGQVDDDFFLVIRTSETISHGDDFQISVRSTQGLGQVVQPITFYPNLLNSQRHPWPQTLPDFLAYSFEDITTPIFKCPTVTVASFHTAFFQGERHDATSDTFPIFGLDFYSAVGATTATFEKVNAIRMQARNISGFDPRVDLKPVLSSGVGASGLGLWIDNGNGFWDTNDTPVDIMDTNWDVVFYVDNPGKDGRLNTSDDPGTTGQYDEGIDELFLDDGYIPGRYDQYDTLIEDGQNDKIETVPSEYGTTDSVMRSLPKGSERWSVLFVPKSPVNIPTAYDGGSPDVFLTARTSERITLKDTYKFELSRGAVTFTSGKSRGNIDLETLPVDTNVPTYLMDTTTSSDYGYNGRLTRADRGYPVVAMNMVNDSTYESYVTSVRMIFTSIGDASFEPTLDLQPILPVLVNGQLKSGVSLYRDADGDGVFNVNIDDFVELSSKPEWTPLGDRQYEIVMKFRAAGQDDLLRVPKDKDRLETGEIHPDFFIVVMPSFWSTQGDDFTVRIPAHGIKFRDTGIDSGETITTLPLTIRVNIPPTIVLGQPPSAAEGEPDITESIGQKFFTIEWRDSDNDDNADVNLYYYPASSPGENNWQLINVGGPIPEDDNTDNYQWQVGEVPSGDYRVVATIDDGFNPRVEDHSGILRIRNMSPTIFITNPGAGDDIGTTADTFTIRWIDNDPDNDALIDLYITPEIFNATYELTQEDILDATKVANDLSEDQNGTQGFYILDLVELLESGLLEFEVPQTVIATIDDNVPVHEEGIVDYATFSLGTFQYERELYLRITEPTGENLVRDTFPIQWEAASSGGRDATLTLRFTTDNFGFGNDIQIPGGVPEDEFEEDSLIVEASYKVLDGTYVWDIVDFDGKTLTSLIPPETDYYIYGQLDSVSGEVIGNFSAGTVFVRNNLFELTTPAEPRTIAKNSYTIEWIYSTDRAPAAVTLYFDFDNEPGGGVPFARGLAPNNGYPMQQNKGKYVWDITNLPSGQYWIYGVFDDQYDETILSAAPGSLIISTIVPSKLFMMDGYGQFHFDGPEFKPNYPLNFGWDIMRSVKVDLDAEGFFLLDAFGGLYPYGDVENLGSMYFYQDGVKDIELVGTTGYYILNGYGLVDYRGSAEFFGDPPFTGQDRYIDIEPTRTGRGYYVLDVAGGVHTFGDALTTLQPSLLTDAEAVDIELTEDGTGLFMLDSLGRIYATGTAKSLGSIRFNEHIASDLAVTAKDKGYVVMDKYGLTYSFGLAGEVQFVTQPLAMPLANDMEYARAELMTPRTVITEIWDENILPAVSSDWVIWSATTPDSTTTKDLFSYHIPTGATYSLVFENGDQVNPSIYGDMVTYTSLQNQSKQIYGVVTSSTDNGNEPFLIAGEAPQQEQSDISKNIVVYSSFKQSANTWDIVLKDLDIGVPFTLTPNTDPSSERTPSVAAYPEEAPTTIFVAYESWKSNQSDLYLWTGRSNGQGTIRVIKSGPGDQYQPEIRYPWLAYTDSVNGVLNVRMYSLATGEDFAVTNSKYVQWRPALGNKFVAWVDKRFDVWDVFLLDFLGSERKLTTGFQIVRVLRSAEENLVWIEYDGERWQLVLNRVGNANQQPQLVPVGTSE